MSTSYKVLHEFSDIVVSGKVTQGAVISATENLTSAATLTSSDSAKIFFLNLAGGFTVTLPEPTAGLSLKFIVGIAPSGADYILDAGSAIIHGVSLTAQDAGGSSASTNGTATATIHLVDAKAVVGDVIDLISNGTSWFAQVSVKTYDAATFV